MIRFLDLKAVNSLPGLNLGKIVKEVAENGWYLKGPYTRRFEQAYAEYIGTRHCVGCGNGLDALTLILRAYMEMGRLHRGDEVIVPANTYIATILSITENGLIPVLVEPDIDTLQIDERLIETVITPQTRAIMIVHLYGRCAYTAEIGRIVSRHNLLLIEDNAQAHGCCFGERKTGSLGHAAAHSFYPTKNLGALGDAGAITTDDDELASVAVALGNYGSDRRYHFRYEGRNSRIDEIQAAVLLAKLSLLDQWNQRRRDIAHFYHQNISHPLITIPGNEILDGRLRGGERSEGWGLRIINPSSSINPSSEKSDSVYHLFPVLSPCRDQIRAHLLDAGIETDVHYPVPPHLQPCYQRLEEGRLLPITERIHNEIFSLPCNPALTDTQAAAIVEAINGMRSS